MNKTYIIIILTLVILLAGTGIYAYKSGLNPNSNSSQSLNSSSSQISSTSSQTPKPVASSQVPTVVSSMTPTASSQTIPVSTTTISTSVSSSTVALVSVTPASISVVGGSSSSVKVVEKPKAVATCNQPKSENLVKIDEGCFELNIVEKVSGKYSDHQLLEIQKMYNTMATNYYSKIHNKFISKKHIITMDMIDFNEKEPILDFSMIDEDYYILNNIKNTDNLNLNTSKYQVNLNNKTFKVL